MKTAKKILALLLTVIMAAACFGMCCSAADHEEYKVGDEYPFCTVVPEGTGRVTITQIEERDEYFLYDLTAEPIDGYMFAGWYRDGWLIGHTNNYGLSSGVMEAENLSVRFISAYQVGDRFFIPEQYDPGEGGYAVITDIGSEDDYYGRTTTYTVTAVANEGYRFTGWYHYHNEELMVYSDGVILNDYQLLDLHPKFEKKPTGFAAFWEKVVDFFRNFFDWINHIFSS